MEKNISVRGKALVQPSLGRRIFIKALWAAVAFLALSAIIGFFVSGFKISILLEFAVPVMILSRFTRMEASVPHYEFFLTHIEFGDSEMKIHYESQGKQRVSDVRAAYRNIQKVEYSEQLKCFRLTFDTDIPGASNKNYHLLYMEPASNFEFTSEIEKRTGLQTVYVD